MNPLLYNSKVVREVPFMQWCGFFEVRWPLENRKHLFWSPPQLSKFWTSPSSLIIIESATLARVNLYRGIFEILFLSCCEISPIEVLLSNTLTIALESEDWQHRHRPAKKRLMKFCLFDWISLKFLSLPQSRYCRTQWWAPMAKSLSIAARKHMSNTLGYSEAGEFNVACEKSDAITMRHDTVTMIRSLQNTRKLIHNFMYNKFEPFQIGLVSHLSACRCFIIV